MPADITVAVSGSVIKNGTIVASALPPGETAKLNTSVSNRPTIGEVETKYEERFDDPLYYGN